MQKSVIGLHEHPVKAMCREAEAKLSFHVAWEHLHGELARAASVST